MKSYFSNISDHYTPTPAAGRSFQMQLLFLSDWFSFSGQSNILVLFRNHAYYFLMKNTLLIHQFLQKVNNI